MSPHETTRHSVSHQKECLGLLHEKVLFDVEGESPHADPDVRLKALYWAYDATDSDSDDDGSGSGTEFSSPVGIPRLIRKAANGLGCVLSVPWYHWTALFIRVGLFLLPSFVQGRLASQHARPEKLTPTSYLDGMRGLAALFVFFCHYFYQAYRIADGWGAGTDNYSLLKLPLIRLFYQGPPAVCLFFVISGYALSYKPLKLMRNGQFDSFSANMSSMTFRRFIRLYTPPLISTLMIVIMLRLGVYEWTRDFASDRTYMRNVAEPHPDRLESTPQQLVHWGWSMFKFVHVFGWERFGGSTGYDVHLWTIPVELRCSMYLFMTIIGVARLRTSVRFIVMFVAMAFTYRNQRWELLLFYFGMLLAEYDLIRGAHIHQPALPLSEISFRKNGFTHKFGGTTWAAFSVLALYLMSQPDLRGHETPGWVWLHRLIPSWWEDEPFRYWQSVGSVLFVFCVGHMPSWQRFFNTPLVAYFGKISFAIYLMHGPVMHTLGYTIERWAYSITGVDGAWFDVGFALGACGCIPAVIWAADVFWRLVDAPTVRFSRWLEIRCNCKQA